MGAPALSRPSDAAAECVLGVTRSLSGRRWIARACDARAGAALAQRLALPEIVGRVLAARGVGPDDAADFLEPKLRALLPDPNRLLDMDRAARRFAAAVMAGEQVAVFADYDVDGATSAALLHRFLSALGRPPLVHVPDRQAEGYGPNAPALLRLKARGARLVVTVDCGTTAFEPLEAAARAGLEVLVLDHHVAEPRLPEAVAVVNPNRLDQEPGLGHLAACGVTFLLLVAANRVLREAGWYGPAAGRHEPDLFALLDLVALGTICDVVPLTGVNRALVTQGLKVMGRRGNAGLAALADVARLDERPGAYHAGFILGPRINAGGRVGEAGLGARLLSSDDPAEVAPIARRLDELNRERQEIEARVLAEALGQVEAAGGPRDGLVFAAGEGWHPGVIGIVASRLVEKWDRPACVVGLDGGEGRGSGRSVAGVGLGPVVIAARQAGLLLAGGGHPMAAGFTVARERLAELRDFLAERLAGAMSEAGWMPELRCDGALAIEGATAELAGAVERLSPFGPGNPEPLFVIPRARIVRSDPVGDGHVRCILSGPAGGRLKAIAFRVMDGPLGPALLDRAGQALHLAGRLRPDRWQGREEAQFVLADAAAVLPGQEGAA